MWRAGEQAQESGALTALAEDWNVFPAHGMGTSQPPVTQLQQRPMLSSAHSESPHTCTHANIKLKINVLENKKMLCSYSNPHHRLSLFLKCVTCI